MANSFGADILIQVQDPKNAASFYVDCLGFEISDETPDLVSLHGPRINLFIERGPALGRCWKSPFPASNKPGSGC
jgi:Glyoxalase/Bleomycin resistance protein/Dioxygenase superfamily